MDALQSELKRMEKESPSPSAGFTLKSLGD